MNKITLANHLYCVLDTQSGSLTHFCVRTSDALAVRDIILTLSVPLKDSKLYCICDVDSTFDTDSDEIDITNFNFSSVSPRLVPWSAYKFPETIAENLAGTGLSPEQLSEITKKHIEDIKSSR